MTWIKAQGELVAEFVSFGDWVNRASRLLGGFGKTDKIICLDQAGCICIIGEDFQAARDNLRFPVVAYRLTRSTECKLKQQTAIEMRREDRKKQMLEFVKKHADVLQDGTTFKDPNAKIIIARAREEGLYSDKTVAQDIWTMLHGWNKKRTA